MSSRGSTPRELERIILEGSEEPPALPTKNAFTVLEQPKSIPPPTARRDRYQRPPPAFNDNYNPNLPPNLSKPIDYSPFVPREPLFNDRPVHGPSLKRHYTVSGAASRLRIHWVWRLGYALTSEKANKKPLSGKLLWHQECLNNWQRRGAIRMATAYHAVSLDL